MTSTKARLCAIGIFLLIVLFGLVQIFISQTGLVFYLELIGFIVLLLLSIIAFMGSGKKYSYIVFSVIFLLYIANLALLYYFQSKLYLTLFVLCALGFVLSLPPKQQRIHKQTKQPEPPKQPEKSVRKPVSSQEPHSMVFDENKPLAVQKVTTMYSPGKYVASNRSNQYHEPTCEWAKKIAKERCVWFEKKEEAWEKGYKAHSCVK